MPPTLAERLCLAMIHHAVGSERDNNNNDNIMFIEVELVQEVLLSNNDLSKLF